MPYYVMMSNDIKGIFGAGTNKNYIIGSLRQDGISARAYDVQGNQVARTLDNFGKLGFGKKGEQALFDSKFAFLLGTDKQSRELIGTDLVEWFTAWGVNEITLRVPQYKEWLACVTFVDPDGPNVEPTFQVTACVGASAVKDPPCNWTQEDKPGQLWTPHAEPGPTKLIRDIIRFSGRGRWF